MKPALRLRTTSAERVARLPNTFCANAPRWLSEIKSKIWGLQSVSCFVASLTAGWFCLSNPKVTKHLIAAIGTETYVTLPKGQLIPTLPRHIAQGGSGPLVPGGGHVLVSLPMSTLIQIIPIAHHPTLLSIPDTDAPPITAEIDSYKAALTKCYAKYDAVPVTWEVGRLAGRGGHAHVQVVPVPIAMADKVESAFRKAGEAQGLEWEAEPELALEKAGKTGNYFKVELPNGGVLVHMLRGGFDLQFGR